MKSEKKDLKFLYVLLTLLLLVITMISGRVTSPAFAQTSQYTSVAEDLKKDSSFDPSDYPDNPKDTNIYVIQIAESVNGELFVYTYQPCQKTTYLTATEINMALTDKLGGEISSNTKTSLDGAIGGVIGGIGGNVNNNDNDNAKLYGLTLVSKVGVFVKYKVNDFTVSTDDVRYYNITSIYREWIDGVDKKTENDNIVNAKYCKVGKLYTAETVDGSVKYSCKNVDVVEIKNPYVDFVSYGQQSGWDFIAGVTHWTDIHYIAFSTDKKIDTLMEADVTYITQSYHYEGRYKGSNFIGYSYGDKSAPQFLTLTNKGEIGLDFKQYTWKSISRSADFIKTVELNDEAKTQVKKSEFVLMFLKTSFEEQERYDFMQGHYKVADGTKVSDVAILRLMFKTDGITYNLGALMDKQTGDDIAGNKPEHLVLGFWAYIWHCIVALFTGTATFVETIIALAVIFVALMIFPMVTALLSLFIPVLRPFVSAMFRGIFTAIKFLFIGLWYIISAPFRFVVWIIKKIRGE